MIALIDEAEKLWAAQLLGDRPDFASRNPLHVHLRQRRNQRPLRSLIALEQLGGEPPAAILRNPQLELADPGDQGPAVIARSVAQTARRPLALLRSQRFGHLDFEHLLKRRPHQCPEKLLIPRQKRFHVDRPRLTLPLGHGVHPRQRIPVIATSPAYHDHSPHRILLKLPDATDRYHHGGKGAASGPIPRLRYPLKPDGPSGRRLLANSAFVVQLSREAWGRTPGSADGQNMW